jgi:hypothetical protein
MENESSLFQTEKMPVKRQRNTFLKSLLKTQAMRYIYMVSMLAFILLCGYLLLYAGSLFLEAVMGKWYSADAGDFERNSFWLGYLYGFPSLLGLLGGLSVMATKPSRWYKFKILLFVPAVIWSTLLVLDLLRRSFPLTYWFFWSLHLIAMLLCMFVLFGVIVKICIPYLEAEKPLEGSAKKAVQEG